MGRISMSYSCIDVFNHCLPPPYVEACRAVQTRDLIMFDRAVDRPGMCDRDERIQIMAPFPGYRQILSLSSPSPEVITTPEKSPRLARIGNEAMAQWCSDCPRHFPGFVASLPLNRPEAALEEASYAIDQLGALGVQLYTSVNGLPLDRPEFLAIFELMAQLDQPVWLHPIRGANPGDYPGEEVSKYDLWWAFGWPHETSICAGRLVFSGLFDKWPDLKVITHHAGGAIPMMEGRLQHGFDAKAPRHSSDRNGETMPKLSMEPVKAFGKFYADTATFGSRLAMKAGLAFFGPSQCLFATDFPFAGIRETLAAAGGLPQEIFVANAERILRIPRT